ncbi:MAG: GHKL domain-containing protein [Candidatus Marinimicrobia bacterium]|nr:GHKL domain-containing protein [Candidatus Neomarinimicrobiota bacterium]
MRKDGTVFPLDLGISEMYTSAGKGFLGTVRDLTEQKILEEKVKTSLIELERSNDALQDFTHIASHDLRGPLRKILSFVDMLEGCSVCEHTRNVDFFGRIQNAATRMDQLLEDLLEFSRLTTQSKPFQWVDLNETAREVLDILEREIFTSKAVVNIEKLPEIEAEQFQMIQLFQNLIQNSIKYSKKDVPPEINVSCQSKKGNWVIQFADNGIGFDPKYADRIFKPFERLHGRSAYSGSGIGLAICKKIVSHHKGHITVESEVNKGSKFIVHLPLKNLQKAAEPDR